MRCQIIRLTGKENECVVVVVISMARRPEIERILHRVVKPTELWNVKFNFSPAWLIIDRAHAKFHYMKRVFEFEIIFIISTVYVANI